MLTVQPNEIVNILSPVYAAGEEIPSVMLWGAPGVGKSDGIKSLAKKLHELTGKKVVITDVRLLLFNPIDLRGIPVPDVNKEFAIWLKPQIFNLDPSDDVINIVFLDEISAAPPTVQASAYQLTLDKKVGEHELPANSFIIAAGNRVQDKGVAYKMPTPLANRFTHFEVQPEIEDWKEWAIPNGVHPTVIGFLNFRPNKLHDFDPSRDELAFPTPRSWATVSKYTKIYGSVDAAYKMIAGTIGEGVGVEFKQFAKVYGELPDVEKILNGEKVTYKKTPDVTYALSAALVTASARATEDQLRNLINFTITDLESEFSVLTIRDMLRTPGVKERLLKVKEWMIWAKNYKHLIQ